MAEMHRGGEKLLKLMSCEKEYSRAMPAEEDVMVILGSVVNSHGLMTRVG